MKIVPFHQILYGALGGFVFDPRENRVEFEGPCQSGIVHIGTDD
jgi:hypothetical protein